MKHGERLNAHEDKVVVKAINIDWDYSGDGDYDEPVDLPNEIVIPEGITDEDEISDYISDVTGFCHYGFELSITK